MKPSKDQYFWANPWPARAFMMIFPTLAVLGVLWLLRLLPASLATKSDLWLFIKCLLLAFGIGWFGSIPIGWFILGPIYYNRGIINGAPFHVGDKVRILTGKHRDKIVTIYAIWGSRDQVRVQLDSHAKRKVTDIFCYHEICRATGTAEGDDSSPK